jgi:hypothetical protein
MQAYQKPVPVALMSSFAPNDQIVATKTNAWKGAPDCPSWVKLDRSEAVRRSGNVCYGADCDRIISSPRTTLRANFRHPPKFQALAAGIPG